MERKVLWLISFALVFILWLKIEPAKKDSDSVASMEPEQEMQVGSSDNLENNAEEESLSQTTLDEQKYFKSHPIKAEKPDFSAIKDVKKRKLAFFNYLTPFIREKNSLILTDRKKLIALSNKTRTFSKKEITWISALRERHKLEKKATYNKTEIKQLLHYVDIVPASLVLAQAANESAWGTSRFAIEGNNYFGQWCFRKGCGLVPGSRDEDADHEVQKFHDARASVFAYIDNLNSNSAYKELREIRTDLRLSNQSITGLALVHGLDHYSQRGQEYVDEIEGLIEYNKLWRFNAKVQTAIK